MNPRIKEEMMDRAAQTLEVIGVVVVYFGILAILLYPVLKLAGFLS